MTLQRIISQLIFPKNQEDKWRDAVCWKPGTRIALISNSVTTQCHNRGGLYFKVTFLVWAWLRRTYNGGSPAVQGNRITSTHTDRFS